MLVKYTSPKGIGDLLATRVRTLPSANDFDIELAGSECRIGRVEHSVELSRRLGSIDVQGRQKVDRRSDCW